MDELTWNEAYERFDEYLSETCEPFRVGNLEYDPARVLREIDPIAYRVTFSEWADSEDIDTDALTGTDDR